jgi:hypothetical protein
MAEFTGFPAEGSAFLNKLPGCDKAWFQDHKALYQETLVEPSKAFVEALGDRLRVEVSGGLIASPPERRSPPWIAGGRPWETTARVATSPQPSRSSRRAGRQRWQEWS